MNLLNKAAADAFHTPASVAAIKATLIAAVLPSAAAPNMLECALKLVPSLLHSMNSNIPESAAFEAPAVAPL